MRFRPLPWALIGAGIAYVALAVLSLAAGRMVA